jgi:hypothetical protein
MRVLDKPVSAGRAIIAADGDRSQDKKCLEVEMCAKRKAIVGQNLH